MVEDASREESREKERGGKRDNREKDVGIYRRGEEQVQLQLRRRGVRSSRARVYIASRGMGEEVGEWKVAQHWWRRRVQ